MFSFLKYLLSPLFDFYNEDIIMMMESFGEEQIKKAFAIVAKKSTSNPKRCYAYVRGILSKMQELSDFKQDN